MLTSDLRLVNSPVIVTMNGEKKEYENGSAAEAAIEPYNRLEAKSLSVKEDKIAIELAEWAANAPLNFVGEAAIE